MWKALLALLLLACMPLALGGVGEEGRNNSQACLTPVHYCMIADSSNSIGNGLWTRLTGVIRSIATGFDIGPGAAESKVALVKYGRNVVRDFDFSNNPDKTTVLDAISSAERLQRTRTGGTATPDAILECLKIFEEQGQTGVPQLIMVFTDGVTFYKKLTSQAAQQRLQDAVNMSIVAGTINYGVVFTGNNPRQAQRESLTIAQGVQERAFYNSSLSALELQIVKELSCACSVDQMGNIITYAVGDSVPSDDPCMECVCAADDDITCTDIPCPSPPPCTPGYVLETDRVPGQCCPIYNCTEHTLCSISSDTGNTTMYQVGENVPSNNPCLSLTCMKDGSISTIDHSATCPPPNCTQGYVPMQAAAPGDKCCDYVCEPFCSLTSCLNGGLCCAQAMACVCPPGFTGERCEKCVYNGTEYDIGEVIVTDNPCRRCTCGPSWLDTCYDISCPGCPEGYNAVNREFVPGECCPKFQCEPPCIIDGTGYETGATVPTDPSNPCESKCVCAADGSRDCTMKECPELDCDLSRLRMIPGECCPRCTADGPCETPTHYCIIADSSRSIFSSQVQGLWETMKQVIGTIVEGLGIGPRRRDSKVALVKYAAYLEDKGIKQVEREITFADNTNKPSVLQAILDMQPIPFEEGPGNGGTATPEAIQECLNIFQAHSTAEVPKVIAVFTDGVTHYHRLTPEVARQRLKSAVDSASAAGVTNYGVVFIGNNRTDEAMFEALEIAQQVRDRAFYGGSLEEIKEDINTAFDCEGEE